MQGTLQEAFHCIRSSGERTDYFIAFKAGQKGGPPTRWCSFPLESAADIQRASLSRRADGLFNREDALRVLSSTMPMDACVKFED